MGDSLQDQLMKAGLADEKRAREIEREKDRALAELREACPTLPFLVPGVGAQGGDPEAVMHAAHTDQAPVIVNSSRSIIYASDDADYAEAAGAAAKQLRNDLRGG